MNVSLTPELEKFVSAMVDSGRYNSASEVVREALRLLAAGGRAGQAVSSQTSPGYNSRKLYATLKKP
jgi:putative addiction module CopG family antidote